MARLLPDLRGYARFLAGNASEADDLVQETVVRALDAIGQFRAGTSLRAWMFTILRHSFYEHARRRRTEQRVVAAQLQPDEGAPGAQTDALALGELARHLFGLPPLLREALVLVGAQGLLYDEAAQICGVPAGTMKARVSRARTRLAAAMQDRPRPS